MRLCFSIVLLSLISLGSPPLAADPVACTDIAVTVDAPDPALGSRICQVAKRGLSEMAACGVLVPFPVTINVVDTLPDGCIGLYHCDEQLLEVLSPKNMSLKRVSKSAFADVPDAPFFDSVVIHELAHAAFDAVPCPFGSCPATAEYVAYAMQIMSLPSGELAKFEASFEFEKRVSYDEINAIILFMAPEKFVRKTWGHLSQRGDQCAYIRQIMNGNILFDTEHL